MTPMLLWPRHDRLELLAGSRRRQALRLLGRSEFKALVLPEGVGVSEALLLALEDNLNQRTLNEAEKVLVVNHLSACMDEREVAVRYLPRLGLPPRDEYLARYKGLMELGPAGLDALAGSCLDAESGEALLAMPEKDRAAVLSLLDQLRPGRNKRRQIMTMIPEIARREDCSAASILDEADIKAVLSAENLNRPQREQRVRDILRARRYPNLTRMEGETKGLDQGPEAAVPYSPHAAAEFRGSGFFAGNQLCRSGVLGRVPVNCPTTSGKD